jgi:hypothetical protein
LPPIAARGEASQAPLSCSAAWLLGSAKFACLAKAKACDVCANAALRISTLHRGKFVGSFRKPLVLLGHPQKKVLMRGVSLLRERAHLFGACAPIGGIVQMGMISHSMQYQWTSSTIPFAKIRMAATGSPTAAKKHRYPITSSAATTVGAVSRCIF